MRMKTLKSPLPHRTRPSGAAIDLIVLHATAGRENPDSSIGNAEATLRERGLSYHYLIAKDGTVYEAVAPEFQASHAGSSYGPQEAAAGLSRAQFGNTRENRRLDRVYKFRTGCSVNPTSIGISFVNLNDGIDPYPAVQIAAGIDLVRELRQRFTQLKWVTTHYAVSPKRKSDPRGPGFDLAAFATACGLPAWP